MKKHFDLALIEQEAYTQNFLRAKHNQKNECGFTPLSSLTPEEVTISIHLNPRYHFCGRAGTASLGRADGRTPAPHGSCDQPVARARRAAVANGSPRGVGGRVL